MKRIFDIVIAGSAFIVLAPLMWGIVVLIRLTQGKQVFFRQIRPGMGGKPFGIVKFCTMTNACDAAGSLLPDSERLTRIGRFLRSTSLDELPELWNILKGDMSLVGPRPLLMQYLDRYTPEQARRHETKPGLTGWAQVNGRNNVKFSERLKMDVYYVDNMSMILDFKIIFLTFLCVLRFEDVRTDFESCLTEVDDCGLFNK